MSSSVESWLRVAGLVALLCAPLVKRVRKRLAHVRALLAEEEADVWRSAIDDQGALLGDAGVALLELAHVLREARGVQHAAGSDATRSVATDS
jgi:hypothetical protein